MMDTPSPSYHWLMPTFEVILLPIAGIVQRISQLWLPVASGSPVARAAQTMRSRSRRARFSPRIRALCSAGRKGQWVRTASSAWR